MNALIALQLEAKHAQGILIILLDTKEHKLPEICNASQHPTTLIFIYDLFIGPYLWLICLSLIQWDLWHNHPGGLYQHVLGQDY